VSSDQITYVLVALVVTGVAILLLLAGALFARRGRTGDGRAVPAAGPDLAVSTPLPPVPAAEPHAAAPPPPPPPPPVVPDVVAAVPLATAAVPEYAALPEADHGPDEPGVTSADLEAAARRVHDPRDQEVIEGFLSISPRRRETVAFDAMSQPTATASGGASVGLATAAGEVPSDPYIDEATGLESRAAWDRALAEENARYVRYRRPVGVVVAELDGLARFEREFGPEATRRILAAVGGAMRRGARRTDRVAHVGSGRFLVLLPETDEIQAINYVERVRAECERWLTAGAVALHVAMGWASPSAVGELDTALRTAEERMYAERRRAARAGATDSAASR
jgi:diguanylate cyclase (GGDEF)-like protein